MSTRTQGEAAVSLVVGVGRRACRWACAAVLSCGLIPMTASAAAPGHWDPVTAAGGENIDQVALLRDADGSLHVIWHQGPPQSPAASLNETMVSASGKVGPAHAIVSGWASVGDAAIMRAAGGRLLLIAGAANSNSADTKEWTSSDDGVNWSLSPLPVDYQEPLTLAGALAPDGVTPIVANGSLVHRGIDPKVPDVDLQAAAGLNCCGYGPSVVADGASGAIVVAWYSNASHGDGIYARTVDPATGAPTGATLWMPGSHGSDAPIQNVALTAIPGQAGAYVAQTLSRGFSTSKLMVWKVGSPTSTTVARFPSTGAPDDPAIAATPDGRLWVAWSAKGRIWARRSNEQRTAWGATTSIPVAPHTDTVYKLAVSAQAGVLDAFGAFSPSSTGDVQTWHSQIEPGLSVVAHATTVRLRHGRHQLGIKATVTDAGSPLANASVDVAGTRAQTHADGTALLRLRTFKPGATIHIRAEHTGYVPATTNVRAAL